MPWGKHEGEALGDVPLSYKQWLWEQEWLPSYKGLHAYLQAMEDELEAEKDGFEDVEGFDSYEDYRSYRGG